MPSRLPALVATAAICLAAACARETPREPAPVLTGQPPDSFRVAFETSRGRVVVEVHRAWAPVGVQRFWELLGDGFFDDNRFFRVVPGFIAQFGVNGDKAINAKWEAKGVIPDDSLKQTNAHGTLSFANDGRNTRSHQLFFNLDSNYHLDRQRFVPIGRVVEGLGTVDSIYAGYGDKLLSYQLILKQGNDYLKRYPRLDYIKTARVIP